MESDVGCPLLLQQPAPHMRLDLGGAQNAAPQIEHLISHAAPSNQLAEPVSQLLARIQALVNHLAERLADAVAAPPVFLSNEIHRNPS